MIKYYASTRSQLLIDAIAIVETDIHQREHARADCVVITVGHESALIVRHLGADVSGLAEAEAEEFMAAAAVEELRIGLQSEVVDPAIERLKGVNYPVVQFVEVHRGALARLLQPEATRARLNAAAEFIKDPGVKAYMRMIASINVRLIP